MTQQTAPAANSYDALLDMALAHAVAEGDIVNFRFLFMPASPFRDDSPEDASTPKYDYLFPESEDAPQFPEALALAHDPEIGRFVREQLARKGPPRLPWQLVLALADNALRLGKYTAAAQAYELLRIRRRMQDLTLDKADEQLRRGDVDASVRGYCLALGLHFDYSAFPEPLPAVQEYQERAPALHSVYPASPEQTLALQEDNALCKTALNYLMPHGEFSSRFQQLDAELLVPFTAALIRSLDRDWDAFADAFKEARDVARTHQALFDRLNGYSAEVLEVLAENLVEDAGHEDLRRIPEILSRTHIDKGEWWQYLKALAYHHPGAALFVARQRLSAKEEILVPRFREDSRLALALGLTG